MAAKYRAFLRAPSSDFDSEHRTGGLGNSANIPGPAIHQLLCRLLSAGPLGDVAANVRFLVVIVCSSQQPVPSIKFQLMLFKVL